MSNYSMIISGAIAATHIDSLVKSVKNQYNAMENGNVITLNGNSTATGENEVALAATPVTATLSTDVFYIVDEPINVLVNSKYSGLIDDPTQFNIAIDKIFRAYKPMVGDEVMISTDGLSGSKGVNTHVIPADSSFKLAWATTISGVSLAYKYISTENIPVGNTRVVAYKFRCVKA
jgi:hypothetical protein